VSHDLFRQVLDDRPAAPTGRLSALPVSIAVHALVIAALVVIPLFATDVLPLVQATDVFWTPVLLPPSPPPSPIAPTRRAEPAAAAEVATTPLEPPAGVHRERLIVAEPPVDVPALDTSGSIPGTGVPGGTGPVLPDAPQAVRPAAAVPVGALVTPPVKIRDVSPIYPEAARLARVEGYVIIEAVIGVGGDVQETKVLRPHPLLTEAAVAAVRQWKYTPTLLGGRPVPVIMTVTVNFTLR
jgi:protein TonB